MILKTTAAVPNNIPAKNNPINAEKKLTNPNGSSFLFPEYNYVSEGLAEKTYALFFD